MPGRYWNGHCWVDDPPMMKLSDVEPQFDTSDVREALLDAELNPRTKTAEVPPLVKIEIEVEDPPIPEQPTPNLVDKSIDVFSRNPVRIHKDDTGPISSRTVTRDRQEMAEPKWTMCPKCASEFNATEGDCPVCLVLEQTDDTVVVDPNGGSH